MKIASILFAFVALAYGQVYIGNQPVVWSTGTEAFNLYDGSTGQVIQLSCGDTLPACNVTCTARLLGESSTFKIVPGTSFTLFHGDISVNIPILWCSLHRGQTTEQVASYGSEDVTVAAAFDGPCERALTGFVNIASGRNHACGIRDTGEVYCWGSNSRCQMGVGRSTDPQTTGAVKFPDIIDATDIVAHGYTTCALSTARGWWCWGSFAVLNNVNCAQSTYTRYGFTGINGTVRVGDTMILMLSGGVLYGAGLIEEGFTTGDQISIPTGSIYPIYSVTAYEGLTPDFIESSYWFAFLVRYTTAQLFSVGGNTNGGVAIVPNYGECSGCLSYGDVGGVVFCIIPNAHALCSYNIVHGEDDDGNPFGQGVIAAAEAITLSNWPYSSLRMTPGYVFVCISGVGVCFGDNTYGSFPGTNTYTSYAFPVNTSIAAGYGVTCWVDVNTTIQCVGDVTTGIVFGMAIPRGNITYYPVTMDPGCLGSIAYNNVTVWAGSMPYVYDAGPSCILMTTCLSSQWAVLGPNGWNVTDIAAGRTHSCIVQDEVAYCAGSTEECQYILQSPADYRQFNPIWVGGMTAVGSVYAADDITCVVSDTGFSILCTGTFKSGVRCLKASSSVRIHTSPVVDVVISNGTACYTLQNNLSYCTTGTSWVAVDTVPIQTTVYAYVNDYGSVVSANGLPTFGQNVSKVASSGTFGLVLTEDGYMCSYGTNTHGQCGWSDTSLIYYKRCISPLDYPTGIVPVDSEDGEIPLEDPISHSTLTIVIAAVIIALVFLIAGVILYNNYATGSVNIRRRMYVRVPR